jgi:hypothetical protein
VSKPLSVRNAKEYYPDPRPDTSFRRILSCAGFGLPKSNLRRLRTTWSRAGVIAGIWEWSDR